MMSILCVLIMRYEHCEMQGLYLRGIASGVIYIIWVNKSEQVRQNRVTLEMISLNQFEVSQTAVSHTTVLKFYYIQLL